MTSPEWSGIKVVLSIVGSLVPSCMWSHLQCMHYMCRCMMDGDKCTYVVTALHFHTYYTSLQDNFLLY